MVKALTTQVDRKGCHRINHKDPEKMRFVELINSYLKS